MRIRLFVLFCLFAQWATGQNFVPNPGFEEVVMCPDAQSQIERTAFWEEALFTGSASPDFYHTCGVGQAGVPHNITGFQHPRTGQGFAGLLTYGGAIREYLQVVLTADLVAGTTYLVEFYVTPGEQQGLATDGIGAHISPGLITGSGTPSVLPFTPQVSNPVGNIIDDTTSWTRIAGLYDAIGGERVLTIGNFLPDSSTQFNVLDSISLFRGYLAIDDVSITAFGPTGIDAEVTAQPVLRIQPNPMRQEATIQLDSFSGEPQVFQLIDQQGKEVYRQILLGTKSFSLQRNGLPAGLYILQLSSANQPTIRRKLLMR